MKKSKLLKLISRETKNLNKAKVEPARVFFILATINHEEVMLMVSANGNGTVYKLSEYGEI